MAEAPPFNFKAAITEMVKQGGSDLHLKVGRPPTIRVAGDLLQLVQQPLKPEELKALAEQIMTPRQVKEFAEHKEADFAIGVTGSGKSTALAAMINYINQNRPCNIITIEDPIEFLHRDAQSNISQREVGTDTLSFETGLRHVGGEGA